MKRFFLTIALFGALAACTRDKTPAPAPPPTDADYLSDIDVPATANEWIEKYLCEWYLWHEDIVGKTRVYSKEYDDFFHSLLSTDRNDGRATGDGRYFFSQVHRDPVSGEKGVAGVRSPGNTLSANTPDNTLGFDFRLVAYFTNYNQNSVYLQVTYVAPGSPACDAGLKRGDLITNINGEDVDWENYEDVYMQLLPAQYTGEQVGNATLERCRLRYTTGTSFNGSVLYQIVPYAGSQATVNITAAAQVDTPILKHDILTAGTRKVGYLAYERFTTGEVDFEDGTYNNELKQIFSGWKNQGVNEAVIDLRYNGGGAVVSSWMMACMLADKVGTTFSKEVRNAYVTREYFEGEDEVLPFMPEGYFKGNSGDLLNYFGPDPGANLGLSKVYVLAADGTASASELLMSGLRGANVDVIHIGSTTTGKNVGMDLIRYGQNDDVTHSGDFGGYSYYMWPISFQSFNAKGATTPQDGWDPGNRTHGKGYEIDEFAYPERMCDLGDPAEPLLEAALHHIANNGLWPVSSRSGSSLSRAKAAANIRANFTQHPRQTGMYSAPRRIDLKKN